ncbi:MAG: hypothetical protein DME66_01695 [Verrucomicrobia bacterium]|nr:MAG: hypothetical protein DME66_01695 [Verrucomicrobiota bacterium]
MVFRSWVCRRYRVRLSGARFLNRSSGPKRSYLQTLCREAGEELNESWTKAEASKKIDELQQKTGRGKTSTANS